MAGFVRRFTFVPTLEVIRRMEGTVIIDLAPPPPVTGAGTGAVLIVGESEDGPFAAVQDEGPLEVFGSEDLRQKFGAFGFVHDGLASSAPCSRKHLAELWNGNGFLKLFKLRAQRLIIARVDTSVGEVSFDPLACIQGGAGPYVLENGQQIAVTTVPGGTASSTAIVASVETTAGLGAAFAGILSGDTFGIRIDGGPQVNVTFAGTDTTQAAVIARINGTLGFVAAVANGLQVDLHGLVQGSSGSVELIEVTPGVLAKIGHVEALWRDVGRFDGGATNLPGIAAGDNFDIAIDGGAPTTITFAGTPADAAAAVAVINTQFGAVVAYVTPNGRIRFNGTGVVGTAGSIALAAGAPDALADLGHAPGTDFGDSNVGNLQAVTATEVAAIINGTAGLTAINVLAALGPDGQLRVCHDTAGGTISIASGDMATALGLDPVDTVVAGTDHAGGVIPTGTRVRTGGGLEWVTMQTLDIPAGEAGPYVAKVRPSLDDGTAVGTGSATVTVLVDPADFAHLAVTNPAALTAAKTEPQMDNAYIDAFNGTLSEDKPSRDANFSLASRRSDTVVREGKSNAEFATANGMTARKFITGDPLGTTLSQIFANVALYRSDRVFYTGKGWKVRVPDIAERGVAGGLGFTADGVITVRPDGPLTTLCAILPPEENPGQQTGLIEDFFQVDTFGETLAREAYEAAKAQGVALPRVDRVSGSIYQSGVTSSLTPGRINMSRRKMADFIQDTAAQLFPPFAKKLNRQSNRDLLRGLWEAFLSTLKSENNKELQRVEDIKVDDSINAGNTPAVLSQGVYFLQTQVRTLSSLDDIVVQTEIGEGVVINREL